MIVSRHILCRLFGHRWVKHRFFAARWNQCKWCGLTDEGPSEALAVKWADEVRDALADVRCIDDPANCACCGKCPFSPDREARSARSADVICAYCANEISGGPKAWHDAQGLERCTGDSPTSFHEPMDDARSDR